MTSLNAPRRLSFTTYHSHRILHGFLESKVSHEVQGFQENFIFTSQEAHFFGKAMNEIIDFGQSDFFFFHYLQKKNIEYEIEGRSWGLANMHDHRSVQLGTEAQ